ncbi:MAG: PTS sugar transporter subunit IIA [Candidatus Krumholzibacteria bacterium]|jgi:fructose-specific phosphotransferase system IIA component|nr:PTS sugar transporter subunit IIA [Candidatus Krumholzibacteria bacterium]MDP6669741.1 PTS sugar transporter subunit IIA [Candidatus Krumholzibacteria bacterium]MDP6796504.1 PTS sugar transporter subunit IIA [Candidatus Krumholzibacteria bacterium]MDP7021931.1 PTS sugar transporter subunit IIA [Candidatus Krumholzibacteria bacterium]
MRLCDYLDESRIFLGLEAGEKNALFAQALGQLEESDLVRDTGQVLRDLELREEIMSTGIGEGVAIPHAQSSGVLQMHLVFLRPSTPLDFDAVDGRPVDLIFLILGPEEQGSDHVKILARISRLIHGEPLRKKLREAGSPAEVLSAIRSHEES